MSSVSSAVLETGSSHLDIPESHLEKMAVLYRYWKALPGDRPRDAIDPVELGSDLLPHVSLGTFIDGCTDFRYELISSEIKQVAPRLKPGSLSSDALRIQQTDFDLIHHLFMSTGRTITPKALRVTYASMEYMPRGINTLFLPLGRQKDADGKDVACDMMIGLWRFEPERQVRQDRYVDILDAFETYMATREA